MYITDFFETWIYNGWIKICKSCIRGKDKCHLMHWIRTDKVNWVCERGRFTTIKKIDTFCCKMWYHMIISWKDVIHNYYYLLLTNKKNLFWIQKRKNTKYQILIAVYRSFDLSYWACFALGICEAAKESMRRC